MTISTSSGKGPNIIGPEYKYLQWLAPYIKARSYNNSDNVESEDNYPREVVTGKDVSQSQPLTLSVQPLSPATTNNEEPNPEKPLYPSTTGELTIIKPIT